MGFRKRTINQYSIIFTGTAEGESEAVADETFAKKWGYFGLLYRLCNGEISKLETITRLNVLEAFTWLSYETDLESMKRVNINGNK